MSAAVGVAGACGADVVVLAPVADNSMIQDQFNLTQPLSNGVGDGLYVGRTSGMTALLVQRGLIRFDLSVIPCGATVTEVRLTMTLERGSVPDPLPVALHRVLGAWGEGTSSSLGGTGAPSTAGDASWQHRVYPDVLWNTEGGDFVAAGSATIDVPFTPAEYSWSGAGLVTDVSEWIASPSSNFGWLVKGDEQTNGSARKFISREGVDTAKRPSLMVEYTPRLCVADVNCDGTTDLSDYFDFFNCWDTGGLCAEVDGIEGVDLSDFFAFFNAFDAGC